MDHLTRRNLVTLALVAAVAAAHASPVALQKATATFSQTFDRFWAPAEMIDGVTSGANGWAIYEPAPAEHTNAQTAAFQTVTDLTSSQIRLTLDFNNGDRHLLGRFRLSATTDNRAGFCDGLAQNGNVTANWTVLGVLGVNVPGGLSSTVLGDGSVLVNGAVPSTGTYVVDYALPLSGVTGFRIEAMTDTSLPTGGPGLQPNGNFVLSEFTVDAVPEPATMAVLGLGSLVLARRRRA